MTPHTIATMLALAAGLVGAGAFCAGWFRAAGPVLFGCLALFAAQGIAAGDYWAAVLFGGAAVAVPVIAWQHVRTVRRRAGHSEVNR